MVNQTAEGQALLDQMVSQQEAMATALRNPNIPEGTILAESDIDGQQVRWKKPSSMVRMGKVPLPERFEAWDKFGRASMLPTAMMSLMLSKPRADSPNERAFHTHVGVNRTTCKICPADAVPFEGTCEWCLKRSAGSVTKKFDDEDSREKHYMAFHQQEFEALQRRLEREDRKAMADTQNKLAEAMMKMATNRQKKED